MLNRKSVRYVRWFIYLYIISFAIIAFLHGNHEFFYYSIVYLVLLGLIYVFQKRYKFELQLPGTLLLGYAIFGLAHFAGGLLIVGHTRLYDIPIGPIHYDNLVHTIGSFLVTITSFNLIYPYVHEKLVAKRLYLLFILVLISLGIGSLNENIEFSSVVFLHDTGIGDYFNNALDLVFNLVGALLGSLFVMFFLLEKKVQTNQA